MSFQWQQLQQERGRGKQSWQGKQKGDLNLKNKWIAGFTENQWNRVFYTIFRRKSEIKAPVPGIEIRDF